jgi:hypothetical protein
MIVTEEMLEEQTKGLHIELGKLGVSIDRLKRKNVAMAYLLREIREYLAGEMDIVDGPEGQQLPNRAMRFCQEIDELVSA